MRAALIPLAASALLLGACSDDAPAPSPVETELPEGMEEASGTAAIDAEGYEGSTPMAERTATLGLLNKRNNLSQDIELKPGQSQRLGDVIVRLSACERTLPWEMPKETGAFVQVLVRAAGEEDQWAKVFSGWLYKNSPSVNVVEHPVYDVWVKDCAMNFPGEPAIASASEPAPGAEPSAEPTSESTESGSE